MNEQHQNQFIWMRGVMSYCWLGLLLLACVIAGIDEGEEIDMQDFMAEMRKAMISQYELLQNIRYHTALTKKGLIKVVKENKYLQIALEDLRVTCGSHLASNGSTPIQHKPKTMTVVPPRAPQLSTNPPLNPTEGVSPIPCVAPYRDEEITHGVYQCLFIDPALRLSWKDARIFCSAIGGELTYQHVRHLSVYLNGKFGFDGTRVQWPFWVGANSQHGKDKIMDETAVEDEVIPAEVHESEPMWRWVNEMGVEDEIWSTGEPRWWNDALVPEGVCMILDGTRNYNGASLPCQNKRRFICQLL